MTHCDECGSQATHETLVPYTGPDGAGRAWTPLCANHAGALKGGEPDWPCRTLDTGKPARFIRSYQAS